MLHQPVPLYPCAVRSGLVRAVVAALVLALVTYVASTALLDAWHRSQEVETSGPPRLPDLLYNAPESVATTERRGPVGPVAAVFAGTRVLDGLVGDLDDPWIAVSSRTGDYRAISGPDLPAATPGGVAVSSDGELVAWAGDDELVVHETVTGGNRVLQAPGITAVGAFAPDDARLLVQAGELRVVDVLADAQVSALGEVPDRAVAQAVWHPDGTTISLVDGRLVEIDVASGRRTSSPVGVSADAQLAWSPAGDRLVSLQEISGAQRLQIWERGPEGRVSTGGPAPAEGIALKHLLGFTDDGSVAVAALALESGTITRVFEVPVDDAGSVAEIGQLPGPGDNWVGAETLEVAADALRGGTASFDEPRWPWSHLAKLSSSLILALFALGMYLTRPPRYRRRRRRRPEV